MNKITVTTWSLFVGMICVCLCVAEGPNLVAKESSFYPIVAAAPSFPPSLLLPFPISNRDPPADPPFKPCGDVGGGGGERKEEEGEEEGGGDMICVIELVSCECTMRTAWGEREGETASASSFPPLPVWLLSGAVH